ncbi:nitroreductase family protein [Chryseolinea lacunae]|uniref:Nitroreductase n=1 Tax=Chryseolinea lacunae TaxID=2801331 RepID=A0ABS1KQZ3_9BACT|nr:nitroreductase [Chryseolinea lacunae]MBL0741728.1 nitroreductase [Chryseolinea lacunae]
MNFNPESANALIQNRRSVFQAQYSGAKVDDAIVEQMLANANWAPTHKLTEPWRFVVFTDEGIKKLAEFQAALYKKVTTADGSFKEDKFNNLLTKPLLSSHIIAVGMKRDEKKSLPQIEEIGAVFCAVENMHLTATAYGVGGYLSTGGVTYFEEAKTFFGWGNDDLLLGFFHIGMPKGTLPDGRRKPIEEKVTWVR